MGFQTSPALTRLTAAAAGAVGLAAVGGGAALLGARIEAEAFILRRASAAVLEPGQRPVRILHLSDLHLSPGDRRRMEWTQRLADLKPDLVVDTGDNLAHVDAVPTVLEALGSLLDVPGVFVLGSNDYYGPRPKSPLSYLGGPSRLKGGRVRLPTSDLVAGLTSAGWVDLDNTREAFEVAGQPIRFVGLDDPHIQRDRFPASDAQPTKDGELRVGVVHAPYLRALRALVDDGSELVLAGHTHGGQICLPWSAIITNCDLPRRYAKGLHRWTPDAQDSSGASTWLHVSAGLGTSPYARIRLFCRPEATLLTLVPRAS